MSKMSNMYGSRRIVFDRRGRIAICGKHEGSRGGSWRPMGRYKIDAVGRTEVYMVDNPFQLPQPHLGAGPHLDFIGIAHNRTEAKRLILEACQNNPEHCMGGDEYVDEQGKVQRGG
jgi:hypothetical protein